MSASWEWNLNAYSSTRGEWDSRGCEKKAFDLNNVTTLDDEHANTAPIELRISVWA